jgi:cell division septation protein DedD
MVKTLLLRALAVGGAVSLGAAFPVAAQESPPDTQIEEPPPDPVDPPPDTVPDVTIPDVTIPEVTIPEVTLPDLPVPDVTPPTDPAPPDPSAAIVTQAVPELDAPEVQAPEDPPGNNGTVKVDGGELDNGHANEPHVGCSFLIEFFGYDEGDLYADVTFEGQPPTGGGTLLTDSVFIGEDPANGGDLDASKSYNLSAALAGIEPHPTQGHHVKLTVNADGSQGADTKHKTFWVEGCGTPPTTVPPTTVPPTTEPPTTEPPTTAPPTTAPAVIPAPEPPAPAPPAPAPKVEELSSEELPHTGSDVGALILTAVLLVVAGAALVGFARSRFVH